MEWPIDPSGKRAQADQEGAVLVDAHGKQIDAKLVRPSKFAAFDVAAFRELYVSTYQPSDQTHWQFVDFRFRASDGGPVSRAPGMGAWKPTPPVPSGGIRIFRTPGVRFPNGADWPQNSEGFLYGVTTVRAFVDMDGRVTTASLNQSSGQPVFDAQALRAVMLRLQAKTAQAHWQIIPVDFLPFLELHGSDALTPASRL